MTLALDDGRRSDGWESVGNSEFSREGFLTGMGCKLGQDEI